MVSSNPVIVGLVIMIVVGQANSNHWGSGQQQGGIDGQQSGFRRGIGGPGRPDGFGRRGGGPDGSWQQGGPSSNGMGFNGGSERNCQKPACFTQQTNNDTINQIYELWTNYVAGTNCTPILQQEDAILRTAIDEYIAVKVTYLSAPAQIIFGLFYQAYDALKAATTDVQRELMKFEAELMMEGGPGPSHHCSNRWKGK